MTNPEKESRPLFALAIATLFGIGLQSHVAPGTFGSVAGLLLLDGATGRQPSSRPPPLLRFSLWVRWRATRRSVILGRTDPPHVIIDEVMGMLITLFLNPVGFKGMFIGFLSCFARRMSSSHIPPIAWKRLPGGIGCHGGRCHGRHLCKPRASGRRLHLVIWSFSHLVISIDQSNDQITR